jgi:hypothetical protein
VNTRTRARYHRRGQVNTEKKPNKKKKIKKSQTKQNTKKTKEKQTKEKNKCFYFILLC